jgi:hypothetical protein
MAIRGEFFSKIEVSQWKPAKEIIAKPAGSSTKTTSSPRKDVLEDICISAVRVSIFPRHVDSISKIEGDPRESG